MRAVLTKAQRQGCYNLWIRTVKEIPPLLSYSTFRRRAEYDGLLGCLMVPYCGMWVGIESDGYTHS